MKKSGKATREVGVLPRSYNPTKKELEEDLRIDASPEQLAQAIFNTRPEPVNIDTGYEPEPEEHQDLIIKEQLIRDSVSGLTLRFFSTSRYNRLSIYGENLEFGNRDFSSTRMEPWTGRVVAVGVSRVADLHL